jgi:hypothetical protein
LREGELRKKRRKREVREEKKNGSWVPAMGFYGVNF